MVDVVDCPAPQLSLVAPPNGTSPPGGGGGNTTNLTLAAMMPHLVAAYESLTHSATTSPAGGIDYDSGFVFASTTVILGIVAFECALFALHIVWKMQGVRELIATEDDDTEPLEIRRMDPSTDNTWWITFFFAAFLQHIFGCISLQLHPRISIEAVRGIVTAHRVFIGAECLLLTMALNHQRVHRTTDQQGGIVSKTLQRQVVLMNKISGVIFVVFIASDFIASHLIFGDDKKSLQGLFWMYIVMLFALSVPMWLCTIWVCFHRAEVEPSANAKRIMFVGSMTHFLFMMPASFWNAHVLKHWVRETPCPLHVMSFYDLVLICNVFGKLCFFIFAKLEYNRNRLLRVTEQFREYSTSLNTDRVEQQVAHLSSKRIVSDVSMQLR